MSGDMGSEFLVKEVARLRAELARVRAVMRECVRHATCEKPEGTAPPRNRLQNIVCLLGPLLAEPAAVTMTRDADSPEVRAEALAKWGPPVVRALSPEPAAVDGAKLSNLAARIAGGGKAVRGPAVDGARAATPNYPCQDCGAPRTKAQGGTVFTVCDACWDKSHAAKPERGATERPYSDDSVEYAEREANGDHAPVATVRAHTGALAFDDDAYCSDDGCWCQSGFGRAR